MEKNTTSCQLTDGTIAHFTQLLQLAIITGTDIVDHFRLARFSVTDEGKIVMNPEYENVFKSAIKKMTDEAERMLKEKQEEFDKMTNQNRERAE